MHDLTIPPEIRAMSVNDRIQLVQSIWDSIVEDNAVIALNDEQKSELDSRLLEMEMYPERLIPSEEVFRDLIGE